MNRNRLIRFFSICFLFIVVNLLDCNAQESELVKISGTINNTDSIVLVDFSKYYHLDDRLSKFKVNKDGAFSITCEINSLKLFQISDKKFATNYQFVVFPGDSININIPGGESNYNIVKLIGSKRTILTNDLRREILLSNIKCLADYFNLKDTCLNSKLYWDLRIKCNKQLNLTECIDLYDNIHSCELKILEHHLQSGYIDSATYQIFEKSLVDKYKEMFYSYCNMNFRFDKFDIGDKSKIDSTIRSFQKVQRNSNEIIFAEAHEQNILPNYINFVYSYKRSFSSCSKSRKYELSEKFKLIKDSLQGVNRDIAFYWLSDNLFTFYKQNQTGFFETADSISNFFLHHKSTDYYFDRFQSKLREVKKYKIGELYVDFVLPDSLNNKIQLSDFKDKYVLVHFWGTWCGGCITAIPKINELYDELDKNKIEFIHIAEENFSRKGACEKWKKLIQKEEMKGVNVHTYQSNYDFGITGYPRYILLERGNKIKRFFFYLNDAYIEWLKKLMEEE